MIDTINSHGKEIDGRMHYPRMYGDRDWYTYFRLRDRDRIPSAARTYGDVDWYAFSRSPYAYGAREIYYLGMRPKDRDRVGQGGWWGFVEGRNLDYPEKALRGQLGWVRKKIEDMRNDPTTPETRLSDDPMVYKPAAVSRLVELMLGVCHRVRP